MGRELGVEREPFTALADIGELPVPRLLDLAPSSFERQKFFVSDAREPLARALVIVGTLRAATDVRPLRAAS